MVPLLQRQLKKLVRQTLNSFRKRQAAVADGLLAKLDEALTTVADFRADRVPFRTASAPSLQT